MADDEEIQKINQAVSTAETFSHLYYKKLDQERHTIDKMYHENANMAWNGNAVDGVVNIQKFLLEQLPKSSTIIHSLDAQPVHDSAVSGQTTVLVAVAGSIKYGTKPVTNFQQNFLLTAKDSKWKVVTDTFRSQ